MEQGTWEEVLAKAGLNETTFRELTGQRDRPKFYKTALSEPYFRRQWLDDLCDDITTKEN
jgi:hypothetical protein